MLSVTQLVGFAAGGKGTIAPPENAGSATSTTNNTTLVASSIDASVGDMLVVVAAADNSETGSGLNPMDGGGNIADSAGNTWTELQRATNQSGGQNNGSALNMWGAPITNVLSSGTVTITLDVNTQSKAMQIYRIPGGASLARIADESGSDTTAGTSHGIGSNVNVDAGQLILCVAAVETNTTITGDADTTGGAWDGFNRVANTGSNASSMSCISQWKIPTISGDQNWAVTTAGNLDSCSAYVIWEAT